MHYNICMVIFVCILLTKPQYNSLREKMDLEVKGCSVDENDPHWASTSNLNITKTSCSRTGWKSEKAANWVHLQHGIVSGMTLATMLDPRFTIVISFSPLKGTEAVKRLKSECAAEMRSHEPDLAEEPSSSHGSEPSSGMKTHLLCVYMQTQQKYICKTFLIPYFKWWT